jgi:hypothetical protein
MRFNAYAYNNLVDTNEGSATSTNLNIDLFGEYTIIPTGETKLLAKGLEISLPPFERSIDTFGDSQEGLTNNLQGYFQVFSFQRSQHFSWSGYFLQFHLLMPIS